LNNYALLSGHDAIQHIGGAEVQQAILGRALATRGYSVSFVTLNHGQPDGIEIDGVRVFKAYSPTAGIRHLRFLHPAWTGLCQAMKRADAQFCYQRMANGETGQVALWCGHKRRKFVSALAAAGPLWAVLYWRYALPQSLKGSVAARLGLKLA
jgi:hypothetical protein